MQFLGSMLWYFPMSTLEACSIITSPPKCWPCGPDKSCPISGLGLQEVQLSPLRMRSGQAEDAPTSMPKAPVKPVGFEPRSLRVRGRRFNHYATRASLIINIKNIIKTIRLKISIIKIVRLSVCVCLSVCLYVCMSVCLFVYLFGIEVGHFLTDFRNSFFVWKLWPTRMS